MNALYVDYIALEGKLEETKMSVYVVGDIHGNYKALRQVLGAVNFNYEEDTLISLGDETDGLPDTYQVLEELMRIKNVILVKGNHSEWCRYWMNGGFNSVFNVQDVLIGRKEVYAQAIEDNVTNEILFLWYNQGGKATLASYENRSVVDLRRHKEFLNSAVPYLEKDGMLFVHGGYYYNANVKATPEHELYWDRDLFYSTFSYHHTIPHGYKKIFIGHTTTEVLGGTEPLEFNNIVAMDTGAGWSGRLTLMNVDTGEYVQSDLVQDLYPYGGR